jgi:hypothetical protein
MHRVKYLGRSLSRKQKELYAQIVELKQYRAVGHSIKSCKILMQYGLIMHNPNSRNIKDFVLNGKPLRIPVNGKLPLKKDIVEEIKENPKKEAVMAFVPLASSWSRAAPDHTNMSREDYIHKWLSVDVKAGEKEMVKVKCLNDGQMEYIIANHKEKTAQQMAEHLRVERYAVNLFCQANDIEPLVIKKRKPKDDFHCIPHERQLRMKKVDYNGPQKKTA